VAVVTLLVVSSELILRDVQRDDVELYVRMRCDPVMMQELGGPRSPHDMAEKVRLDAAAAQAGSSWILMIVPDRAQPALVAGTVTLWSHADDGSEISEIGWMVLPEFQGRGIAKAAVSRVLDRARTDGRWGVVHAYPAVTNEPSNRICRSLGFTLNGQCDIDYYGAALRSHDWTIDTAGCP
jgi:RimJ/RimL family protein N-acetyltransferase